MINTNTSNNNTNISNNISLDQIEFKDIDEISQKNRLRIIDTINSSLNDPKWDKYTNFIARKYLYNPRNYQVFRTAKIFEETVGYVIIRNSKEEQTSYLSYITVDANYQKSGIGKALLGNAIETIQELGVQKIILDCKRKTCSFYEKFATEHGFEHSKKYIGQFSYGSEKMQITIHIG